MACPFRVGSMFEVQFGHSNENTTLTSKENGVITFLDFACLSLELSKMSDFQIKFSMSKISQILQLSYDFRFRTLN